MKIKFFILMTAAILLSSCGSKSGKDAASIDGSYPSAGKVEFTALVDNPSEYVGKTISVEGKVVHVCMHSGKKLFITGENPDIRLFIQAGENMPKFPMDLLGSEVVVEGTLTSVVAAAPAAGEGAGMHSGAEKAIAASADTCETSKAMASQPVLADIMMVYNSHSVKK
jgi:hypothetical protein